MKQMIGQGVIQVNPLGELLALDCLQQQEGGR